VSLFSKESCDLDAEDENKDYILWFYMLLFMIGYFMVAEFGKMLYVYFGDYLIVKGYL